MSVALDVRRLTEYRKALEIHLQLYSILREKLPPEAKGRTVLRLDKEATLADVLVEIGIKRKVVISVNGVHQSDQSRRLRDGDVVKIFSAISGGARPAARLIQALRR